VIEQEIDLGVIMHKSAETFNKMCWSSKRG